MPLHTLLTYILQKLFDGLFQEGMGEIRGQLRQGHEDKTPLVQMGVGDDEACLFDNLGSVEEYIDVNKPWSHRKGLLPSHLLFDTLQKPLEGKRQKGGRGLCHAIDKPVLISVAYGFCFIQGRYGLYMGVIGSGYPLKGMKAIMYLITEVRA